VPIIQWIDRTHVTGNERFSLKPYMFSPAIFKEECRRKIQFWGYHGFLPKRKETPAETQLRKTGENIRNYHAELEVVLHSFQHALPRLRGIWLPLGPNKKIQVNIIPCILFIIQDMQEGDMLCGRYGPHMERIQRQCRACDINYANLSNPEVQCKWIFAHPMHRIAVSGDDQLQKRWSQHVLNNVFNRMPLADPRRGIFGATPVDTMHAFRKGILENTTLFILQNLKRGHQVMLDGMAIDFHERHAQTCRNEYPVFNFSAGITGLTKISASERVGVLFLLIMLANLDTGADIFEAAFALESTKLCVRDIIEVLEAILTFDAWLNKDSYWKLRHAKSAMQNAKKSIQQLLFMCKRCFPSNKWEFPKFHEMLHVVDDMERFGASKNFSAQRPESLLIHAAKRPGRRTQKTKMGALYDAKAAERVVDSFFINRFHDLMHPTVAEETPLSDNNQHVAVDVMNSRGRGTFGQLIHVPDSESISLSWSTKTNQEHLQLPQ